MSPLSRAHIKERIKEGWRHAGFQKYLKNTGWLVSAKTVTLAFSFFVTAYVVRYLGPENYGQLSYSVSFISIFSFVATLGIDQIIYRDLIKHPDRKNAYMGSALVLKLGAGLLATLLSIVFGTIFSAGDVSSKLIVILSFTYVFNSFNIIIYEFQAKVESKYPSIIAIATSVILNVLKICVVFFDKGVIYFAAILLFESVLGSSLLVFYRIKKIGDIDGLKFDRDISVSLLKDSSPLIFSSVFALIYARIDQILIKHMIDTRSVGLYDAAVRLSEVWYFVPNILLSSLFPAIINAKRISPGEYSRRLRYISLALVVIAVAIALPTTFLAPFIMRIIFGAAFVAGAGVLKIYIWSNVGTFLAAIATNYLISENKRSAIFASSCIGMAANVILNLLLIPSYGIDGSAFATLVSYSLIPLSLLLFKEPRRQIFDILKFNHAL